MTRASLPPANVSVLAGGVTFERDISLRSGATVAAALRSAGMAVHLHEPDDTLLAYLDADRPDVVFIALHGAQGEDGSLRRVLEILDVPYVGTRADAARSAWDKAVAKSKLKQLGVATPEWATLPKTTLRELGGGVVVRRVVDALGLPLIVKPVQGGSGLGSSVVLAPEAISDAVDHCFEYGEIAMFERFVQGTNVSVCVVEGPSGAVALPSVEIVPRNGKYDFDARYDPNRTDWYSPARLDSETCATVADIATSVHRLLGLQDLSRVDMVVDEAGDPCVLGVNVSPGMTETSLFPRAVAAAGLTLGEVFADLVLRQRL